MNGSHIIPDSALENLLRLEISPAGCDAVRILESKYSNIPHPKSFHPLASRASSTSHYDFYCRIWDNWRFSMKTIDGVIFKDLLTNLDERGFFRELIRVTDDFFKEGFGQWSHSLMYPGSAKAWHIHNIQTDWWYVVGGVLKVVLYDKREKSPTHKMLMEFFLGDNQPSRIVKIPPGVAHGCKAIGGTVNLLYLTSKTYNPEDEGRIPHDDAEIGYDWEKYSAIK